MTAFNEIRSALESRISTVTGIPNASNRAWENVRFEPTTGTTWVRMTLTPTEQRPAVRGSNPQLRYQGIFQVDVFAPEGNGPKDADTLADNIRNAYTVDDILTTGSTNDPGTVRFEYSERDQATLESPWYMVQVTIAWYSYRQ